MEHQRWHRTLPPRLLGCFDQAFHAARGLATSLPDVILAKAIDTTHIHRITGLTGGRRALVTTRLYRAPPHMISEVGLISGGHVPMPGEVSLAHHAILFLDELPKFRRHVLEVLLQPLKDRMVSITRGSPFASSVCRPTLPVHL